MLMGARWSGVVLAGVAAWVMGGPAAGEGAWKRVKVVGQSGFHHAGTMSEIAVLSDGERVVSSARDGTARLWNLVTGREIRRFSRKESGDVWGVALLPGEREILTAGEDGYVTRWDLGTGKVLKTYKHEGTAFRVALRPGGKEMVATDNKNLAVLWNLETGKKVRTFKGHTKSVYTALFVAGGDRLLTGGSDGKLKVWDPDTGQCLETLKDDFDDIFTMALSPDGKWIAMSCGDDAVRVVAADTLKVEWKEELPDDTNVVAWSPDGKRLVAACDDKKLYVLDARDGEREETITVPGDYHTPVAFNADGTELISGGDRMLFRWNLEDGKRIVPGAGKPRVRDGVRVVAISPDGRKVFAAGEDEAVQVWDVESGRPADRFEAGFEIRGMALSDDGRRLGLGGGSGEMSVIEAASGKLVCSMQGEGIVNCLAFTRDGKWLVTAGSDEKAHLWRLPTGELVRTFEGHERDINGLALPMGDDTLLTASDDKTVRMWELATGNEVRKFDPGDEELYGIACMGDGQSFMVAPREREVWGLLVPPAVAGEALTPARVAELVEQLAANEFARREEASEVLTAQGRAVLPMLEDVRADDPEAAYRLKKIRSAIRHGDKGGALVELRKFEKTVYGLVADATGRYWAAAIGAEADARLVVGDVREQEMRVLSDHSDGHSPNCLSFSADGSFLATGNRDGSVSIFAPGD